MTPTPTQALLLFGLLARHGECAQVELMPAVKKADREALAKAKLITIGKVGRGLGLTLADDGWAWTAAHLNVELPPAQRALSDLLMRLGEHLKRSGGMLSELIGPKPRDAAVIEAEERQRRIAEEAVRTGEEKLREKAEKASAKQAKAREAEGKKQRAAQEKKAKADAKAAQPASARRTSALRRSPPTQAALRRRIEEAYLKLSSGRKDESVRLHKLRAELADLDRATLDAALGRILEGDRKGEGKRKAMLMRHDDPAQIAQADRDAAFNPSGEPFHVIWIRS